MKTFKLELNNKNKKYTQIIEYIKNSILDGVIKPNEKLPSKRILASTLNVSINTVILAYDTLEEEGFIYSVEKKGFYVVDYKLVVTKYDKPKTLSITKENYIYDFTTKDIDSSLFPNSWYKITGKFNYMFDSLKQTENKGLMELRNTLALNIYESKGVSINPNNIIIGSGVEYLLSIIVKLLDNYNFIVENPGYSKISTILKNNNSNIYYQNIDNEGLMTNDLKPNCNIYTTPASQFPTGVIMSIKRKVSLIDYVKNNGTYIIEDDLDSEYKYSSTSTPLLVLDKEKVIYLKTFSRTICPSLRLAYMVLPDKLLTRYEELFNSYSNTVSTINQLTLNEFISSGSYYRHLNKTRLNYTKKKEIILNELNKNLDIIKIINSTGVLSIIIELIHIDIVNLKQELLKNKIKINFITDKTNIYNDFLIIGYSSILLEDTLKYITVLLNTIRNNKS